MKLQEYLRSGGTPESLEREYAIKSKRHGTHGNLVLFKYNQIESPFDQRIVCESRGVILDEANEWACVSRAFDKFFNHGEGRAAAIDWSTARVQTKLDGSLCSMYWYGDRWHVATSGTPDAGGPVNESGMTFADLFWQTYRACGLKEPAEALRGWTFIFELTAPENRVVVVHKARSVTLLGARETATGREVSANESSEMLGGAPFVNEHALSDLDAVAATFTTLSPLAHEGYVIIDAAFRRIKVKHPGYVAIHHAKDGMSVRALVEIARSGEASEVVAVFPELQEQLDGIKAKLDAHVVEIEQTYKTHEHIESQKDFAMAVKHLPYSGVLFQLRAGKVKSAPEFYAGAPIDGVMRALGLKDAPPTE